MFAMPSALGLNGGVCPAEEAGLAGVGPGRASSSSATGRRTAAPTRRTGPCSFRTRSSRATASRRRAGSAACGRSCTGRRRDAPPTPTSERMIAKRSIIRASRGRCSQISMPGTFVRDRLELAANLGRRVRLQIDHVLMRRPAGQEDHDDRLVRRCGCRPAPRRGAVAAATGRPAPARRSAGRFVARLRDSGCGKRQA